jgi:hemerythrin-like domain-containing protein
VDPIETLTGEHALIVRYLDILSAAHDRIAQGRAVPVTFFENGLRFARGFMDEYHHFKEEDVMFALLAKKEDGDIGDELALLRNQHDLGRALVNEMAYAVEGYGVDESIKTALMLKGLAAFTSLLREHIQLEERLIFPLARRVFTPEERDALREQYESERRRFGRDAFERNERLVTDMSDTLSQS